MRLSNLFIQFFQYFMIGLILCLLYSASVNLSSGLENKRVIATFDGDESNQLEWLERLVRENTVNPKGQYLYPFFHVSLAYWQAKAFFWLGYDKNNEFLLAYIYRSLSFISYILLLWVFHLVLSALEVPRMLRLPACLILASEVTLYQYSFIIHPEMLQAFLMLLALLVAILKPSCLCALLAVFIAGLAFGTKYAGFMEVPGLIFPCFLILLASRKRNLRLLIMLSGLGILLIVAFLAGWLISNPYVYIGWKQFIEDVGSLSRYVLRPNEGTPWDWYFAIRGDLTNPEAFILALGLLFAAIYIIFAYYRRDRSLHILQWLASSALKIRTATLIVTTISIAIIEMTMVNNRSTRYILHIFPFLYLLAFVGYRWCYEKSPYVIRMVMIVLIAYVAVIRTKLIVAYPASTVYPCKYASERYQIGWWLVANIPKDTKILSDAYNYIPPYFSEFVSDYTSISPENRNDVFSPEIIVVNKTDTGRWAWKKDKTRFSEGAIVVTTSHPEAEKVKSYWEQMLAPDSPWRIIYESDEVVVFAKKDRFLDELPLKRIAK